MQYKYITGNNLEDTQNYMYAPYGGLPFLEAYYQTRRPFLTKDTGSFSTELLSACRSAAPGTAEAQLRGILEALSSDPCSADRDRVNLFVRRFEVRKRLFAEYDRETGRPVIESGCHEMKNYMLLAAVTARAYEVFGSSKYLSCFLKLNDTLLSLAPGMDREQLRILKLLVTCEARQVTALAGRKNIVLEEA